MITPFVEYVVNQNASFKAQLDLKDDFGAGLNLMNYVVTGHLKKSYNSSNVTANLVCTMVDAANGSMQISIPWSNTANIKGGVYVFDVRAYSASTDEAVRLVEGLMIFSPSVT